MPDISGMRFYSSAEPLRYFVIYGSFVFPGRPESWGAIAVDNEGIVHRGWAIRPERSEYLGGHIGLAITDEGLLATNAHGVLTGFDWCGEKRWEAPWSPPADGLRRDHDEADGYDWHHDVVSRGGRIYTFRGPAVTVVDAASGQIVSQVHAIDLMRWASRDGLGIFDTRRRRPVLVSALSEQTLVDSFHSDPFHFNKVDVLTSDIARDYPEFLAGDLLISMRELNLVVVARPSEQRIVWWRYGLSTAQHDAQFVDGAIELFDNNPTSDPPRPRILRLDLHEQRAEEVFDLSRWKLEMRVLGNFEHQGERLTTLDSFAGRFVSGRLDGQVDFLFENGWHDENGQSVNLQVLNGTEITSQVFQRFESSCQ